MRLILAALLFAVSVPAFAQPNRLADVQRVAAADAARFACAHTDAPCAYDFIQALVCDLRQSDVRWGMNGRRGDPLRPSWDAIAYCDVMGPAADPTMACLQRLTIIDVIAGAGGPDPRPTWQAFTNDPTPGAFLVPECGGGNGGGGTGGGSGPVPTVDLAPVLAKLAAIEQRLERVAEQVQVVRLELGDDLAAMRGRVDIAAHESAIAAREVLIVKDWLAQGLAVSLSARFLGTVNGTVRAPQ